MDLVRFFEPLLKADTVHIIGLTAILLGLGIFLFVRSVFPFMRSLVEMGVRSFDRAWDKMVEVQNNVSKALDEIRQVLEQNTLAVRENTERLDRMEQHFIAHVEKLIADHTCREIQRQRREEQEQQAAQNRRRRFLWW